MHVTKHIRVWFPTETPEKLDGRLQRQFFSLADQFGAGKVNLIGEFI